MDRNRDLFWELLEPEHLRIRAFCRKLARNRDDGDDLCHEALVQAFMRFESLRDRARFRAWLYRIVVNRYGNTCRRSLWQRFLPLGDVSERDLPGIDPAPALGARRLLERALSGISAADRALVVLAETEGWTIGELASMFGRSESATKVRLFRIRTKMRKTLSAYLARSQAGHRAAIAAREDRLCVVTKPSAD